MIGVGTNFKGQKQSLPFPFLLNPLHSTEEFHHLKNFLTENFTQEQRGYRTCRTRGSTEKWVVKQTVLSLLTTSGAYCTSPCGSVGEAEDVCIGGRVGGLSEHSQRIYYSMDLESRM